MKGLEIKDLFMRTFESLNDDEDYNINFIDNRIIFNLGSNTAKDFDFSIRVENLNDEKISKFNINIY